MNQITIRKPDDFHVHIRDGDMMKLLLPQLVKRYRRAIIMPNLKPPVSTIDEVKKYKKRILSNIPANSQFEPLMVLYLTDSISKKDIKNAKDIIHAVKMYPLGATTNSDLGVTGINNDVLGEMEKQRIPLLVHGEVTNKEIDIFDREKVFIDKILKEIIRRFPELKIVMEHITTEESVLFIKDSSKNIAATITPHHLVCNRNDLLSSGIKPHYYCLPLLKRKKDQDALIKAVLSGNPKFFGGSDSAPHLKEYKENDCGCAGCYNGSASLELYFEVFDKYNAIDKIEPFLSEYGAKFYGLPLNKETISLEKKSFFIPLKYYVGKNEITPFMAGEKLKWSISKLIKKKHHY